MGQVPTRSSNVDVTQCRIQQVPTVILKRLFWDPVFTRKLSYFLYPAFTLVTFVAFSILKHLQHVKRKVERGLYRSVSFSCVGFRLACRLCLVTALQLSSLVCKLSAFWQQVGLYMQFKLQFSYCAVVFFLSAFFQFSPFRSTG